MIRGSMRSTGAGMVAALCLLVGSPAKAEDPDTISTSEITSQTSSALSSCLNWEIIGVCLWLRCTITGCSVVTTERIRHYVPDAVISAYQNTGENPWAEIRGALGSAQESAAESILSFDAFVGGGNTLEGRHSRDARQLRFKEADVVGHPFMEILEYIDVPYICPGAATAEAFHPYYQSATSVLAWRYAVPEMFYIESLREGEREIGDWDDYTWGAVYPRSGYVSQPEDAKAAAIVAQRAGDITTREDQSGHVYEQLPGDDVVHEDGYRVWLPPELVERDEETGTFQMHMPTDTNACEVFGEDDTEDKDGWSSDKTNLKGNYVWTLWRPYNCCEIGGQVYLGSVTF